MEEIRIIKNPIMMIIQITAKEKSYEYIFKLALLTKTLY